MTEQHPIRNGVIATVVGGVILAALGLLWPPARRVLQALWHFLTATVPVPVWLVGILLLVAGVVSAGLIRSRLGLAHHTPLKPTAASATSELETQVLKRLVKADGAPVPHRMLLRATGASQLRLQAALDNLESLQIVEVQEEIDTEELEVFLTAKGRQHVVERGLA